MQISFCKFESFGQGAARCCGGWHHRQEGFSFKSRLGPFCVEFACSPKLLPPTVQKQLIGVSKIVLRRECERG